MMEVFTCEQNSPEWHLARMGIPTASMFATVLARGKDGGASVTRRSYLLKLAGEIITGEPMQGYSNADMERGHVMEPEARSWYEFVTDAPLTRVGFIRNGAKGASPDSFVGDKGVLEIKTAAPHILAELLLKDQFPPEHMAQAQGNLWVSEREELDLVVYWPSMPKLSKRLYRDPAYIAKLADAVDHFNDELAEVVEKIRQRGCAA